MNEPLMEVIKWVVIGALLLLTPLEQGCRKGQETLQEATVQLESAYDSDNISSAESALLRHLTFLEGLRASGNRLFDYDHLLGVTHARLYCLYQIQAKTNEAENHFTICTNHIAAFAARRGMIPTQITAVEVTQIVEQADSYLDVAWKKQFKQQAQPPKAQ